MCVLAREGRDARICWSVQEDLLEDQAWEGRQNQLKGLQHIVIQYNTTQLNILLMSRVKQASKKGSLQDNTTQQYNKI